MSTPSVEEKTVLVLGLASSGKTLLVKALKGYKSAKKQMTSAIYGSQHPPTIGVDFSPVSFDKRDIVLCEVGGSFIPIWKNYFERANGIIFCIDIYDSAAYAPAIVELTDILADVTIPVLVKFKKGKRFCDQYYVSGDDISTTSGGSVGGKVSESVQSQSIRDLLNIKRFSHHYAGLFSIAEVDLSDRRSVGNVIKWMTSVASK